MSPLSIAEIRSFFVGRCAVALLCSEDLMERTGTIQWVEDLSEEFDILDENGKRPPRYAQRESSKSG